MGLGDVRVVEIAGSVAGAYAARLLRLGGARVTVVGDGSLTPHQRLYLRSGTEVLRESAEIDWAAVDVVIESSADRPLPPADDLIAPHDRQVRVRITPFPSTGPYSTWRSSDLVDYAISGHAQLYGDPEREPLRGPFDQPAIAAGQYAAIAAMAGLFQRETTGRGCTVEVDHFRVMVALHQLTLMRWTMTGDVFARAGNRYAGAGQPNGPYQCRDGIVSIAGVTEPQVDALLSITGLTRLLDDPRISSSLDLYNHPELLDVPLAEWLADKCVDDVVGLFQDLRIPTCPLRTPLELLDDSQLAARNFFRPSGDDASVLVPGPPFTVINGHETSGQQWTPTTADTGPLTGLRVLDLTRVWAGPLCSRTLADLGADVIRVEAPTARGGREIPQSMLDATRYFPDDDPGERPWNRNGLIIKYALGKRSLAIDLQSAEGRAAFEELVPTAHVLIENFSPRVMPQLGFDETHLHELNPDLTYVTMPGYGRTGPAANWLAYGSCIDSHAGLTALTGYDETPWKGGIAWPDPLAGLHACAALLMRLWGIRRNGGGATIEVAQFESTVAAIGDRIVEAQVDGPWVCRGNHRAGMAHEGMVRCADGSWLAVSLSDHVEFASTDELLETIHTQPSAMHAAHLLQQRGIAAGPVTTAPQLLADPQLTESGAFVTVEQPDVGPFTTPALPFDVTPSTTSRPGPAPTLGQHNREVLSEAGLSADEIADLERMGVIANEPPG